MHIMNCLLYCKAGKKYYFLGFLVAEISVQDLSLCKPNRLRNRRQISVTNIHKLELKKAQIIHIITHTTNATS